MNDKALKFKKYSINIYPRTLYVAIGTDTKLLEKRFCYRNNKSLDFEDKDYLGLACNVRDKKTNKLGVLCYFPDESPKLKVLVHEACHAAFNILRDVGIHYDDENQEPFAYLIEYIFNCIYKTL